MTAPKYVRTMKTYGEAFSIQPERCGSLTRMTTSLISTAKMKPSPPPKAPYRRWPRGTCSMKISTQITKSAATTPAAIPLQSDDTLYQPITGDKITTVKRKNHKVIDVILSCPGQRALE